MNIIGSKPRILGHVKSAKIPEALDALLWPAKEGFIAKFVTTYIEKAQRLVFTHPGAYHVGCHSLKLTIGHGKMPERSRANQ